MNGLLLDSSPLYWLDEGTAMRPAALLAISTAGTAGLLFASEISVWEMGTALLKRQLQRRPNLRGLSPDEWFLAALERHNAIPLPISSKVALEAGSVPLIYNHGDPGDCFLIATARVHSLALVTRDERILDLSSRIPAYLTAIPC